MSRLSMRSFHIIPYTISGSMFDVGVARLRLILDQCFVQIKTNSESMFDVGVIRMQNSTPSLASMIIPFPCTSACCFRVEENTNTNICKNLGKQCDILLCDILFDCNIDIHYVKVPTVWSCSFTFSCEPMVRSILAATDNCECSQITSKKSALQKIFSKRYLMQKECTHDHLHKAPE